MPVKATDFKRLVADPEKVRRAIEETQKAMGIPFDDTATAEKARLLMLEAGIRPEDNILSSEILRMRYPEDYE